MHDRQVTFEWDVTKAVANVRTHGVSFDLARTIFNDPLLLTVADLEHSATEERWFAVGRSQGSVLSVVYLWSEVNATLTKIRIISARKATQTEIGQYRGSI